MRSFLRTAPDVLWVLLALPYFAAVGLGITLLTAVQCPPDRHHRAQGLALACAAGLLVNYALGTLLADLQWVLLAGCAIAAISVTWAAMRRRAALSDLLGLGWIRWLLFAALLLTAAGAILFEPLQGWDARSLWFFNAKRIFFGGGLRLSPDWTNPAYGFSHPDYPMLLPLLAAQFAHAWGVWNEYLPKASLAVLLAPILLGLLGLAGRIRLSLLFLAGCLLLLTKEFLWNGYADTYLGLYAVMSMLYLARWLGSGAALDLAAGSIFMGVAANLKNEGSLLVVSVVASLTGFVLAFRKAGRASPLRSFPPGVWLALVLPWIGFAAWTLTKHHWHFSNDLQLGLASFTRIQQRLREGQIGLVADALVRQSGAGTAAALFLGSAVLARLLRTPVPPWAWFPATVSTLYCAGIFVVYLATPHDVAWHLKTSADRTMLLTVFGFLASTFLVLESLESRGPANCSMAPTTGLQT